MTITGVRNQGVAGPTSDLAAKVGQLSVIAEQMKVAEAFFQNLIESSADTIVTLSSRGRITFVSQGGERTFGYRTADALGAPARRFWIRGRQEFRAFRRMLAEHGRVQNYETELPAADGRIVAVNISASRLRNASGATYGVVAIVRDVTDLRRLQDQLIRSERLAATGLLAAGVAHEISNALTCVSALCQRLAGLAAEPAIRQGLHDVLGHADRIGGIVRDLTHLARPRSFEIRETSAGELIDAAVRLGRHSRVPYGMRIVTSVAPSLPALRVSPDHMLQVFLNLILNAAEAGGDLTIVATRDRQTVRVEFRDTGCGMSAAQLERLFDPFTSAKESAGHLGLGLFVCREIIRHHRGAITVTSRPGAGSVVTIALPIHAEPPES